MCFCALVTNLAFARVERPRGHHAVVAIATWKCHVITVKGLPSMQRELRPQHG